jgi:hypothetical protein
MLGKVAALAAAASQSGAQPLPSPPAACPANSVLAASGQLPRVAGAFSAAAVGDAAATAAAALTASALAGQSSLSAPSAASPELRRMRRDSGRFKHPGAAAAIVAAAATGRHGATAPMHLAVSSRRHDNGGWCGQGFGSDPRAVAEPMTPGRDDGGARSPLRGAAAGHLPDPPLSPVGARDFTAAELRAYEATNQLLRELHFERLGRLSIRDDDDGGSPLPAPHQHLQQQRRRR